MDCLTKLSEMKPLLAKSDESVMLPCIRRRRAVSAQFCQQGFMDAHAHKAKDNPCWQCPAGAKLRLEWAFEKEATPDLIEAVLGLASGYPKPWHNARLGISGVK